MCPVIRISDELYARLETHAVGFDTPSALIERLLDKCDGKTNSTQPKAIKKPELFFIPTDEKEFIKQLIEEKQASVQLYKADGTIEKRTWNANRLSEDSNLRGNLWSGLLRGWKKKGIIKAEFAIVHE